MKEFGKEGFDNGCVHNEIADSQFTDLINLLEKAKEEWKNGENINKKLTMVMLNLFDLAETLGIDLETEMNHTTQNISNAFDYVMKRMLEDSLDEQNEEEQDNES